MANLKVQLLLLFLILNTALLAQKPEIILPVGHSEGISRADYSSNGKYILTESYDNTAIIWNALTGNLVYHLSYTEFRINDARFLGDGDRFFTVCSDATVRIYETESVNLLATIPRMRVTTCVPQASAGGKYIVGIDANYQLSIWKTSDGSKVSTFPNKVKEKSYIHVSEPSTGDAEGIQFISVSVRTSPGVFVVDAFKGATLLDLPNENKFFRTRFSSNIGFFTTKNKGGRASLWSLLNGELLFACGDSAREVESVVINPEKQNAIFKFSDYTAELRNTKDWHLVKKYGNFKHHALYNSKIVLLPDNETYLYTSSNQKPTLFNAVTGEMIRQLSDIPDDENFIKFSPKTNIDTSGGKYFLMAVDFGLTYPTIYVFNMATGEKKLDVQGKKGWVPDADFSVDGKSLITRSADRMEIWDIETGTKKHVMEGQTLNVSKVNYRPGEAGDPLTGREIVTVCSDSVPRTIDLEMLRVSKKFTGHLDKVYDAIYSPDAKYVLSAGGSKNYGSHKRPQDVVKVWNASTGEQVALLEGHKSAIVSLDFNGTGRQLATLDYRGTCKIWDFESFECIKTFKIGWNDFQNMIAFHPSDTLIAAANAEGDVRIYNINTGEEVKTLHTFADKAFSVHFSKNGNRALVGGWYNYSSTVTLFNLETDEKLKLGSYITDTAGKENAGYRSTVYSAVFNKDETKILTANYSNQAQIFDLKSMKIKADLSSHTASLHSAIYNHDNSYILTNAEDNMMKLWNAETAKETVTIVLFKNDQILAITPDQYYMASKNIASKLSWRFKGKFYTFDQFDLKFNRPDIVYRRIGYASPKLIDAYHNAYLKRLKKMGFTEEQLGDDLHIPETAIDSFEYMPEIHKEELELKLNFNDSKYELDRYNIWVNEVPLFGMNGKSLRNRQTQSFNTLENIVLSEGKNRIQVSCMNSKGAESFKETIEVVYTPEKSSQTKLHFIGIGIDIYAQPGHNLQYSVKDISDLAVALKKKYGQNISIDTLFNESVTRQAVLALKQKLLQANVNDKVILSFSGHGLLSSSYDYYLATHNVNFQKPEEGGLAYEDMEWLLDSIPPRKILMLIDACHSGEVDKEELVAINQTLSEPDKKGIELSYEYKPTLGMKNSFELMQEMFTNLNRGTGATVISAAAGTQFAYEKSNLKNGVFTYCILELMGTEESLNVGELKNIVGKRVEELTNGLQKPTSRNENLSNNWKVW